MESILKDINAVAGVTGCFVCNSEGQILGSALPARFDETTQVIVGRTMTQTMMGLESLRRRKIGDIILVFQQGSVIVKNLGESCLFILGSRNINVPLLNLTANLVARKLTEKYKTAAPVPKTTQAPAPKTHPAAEPLKVSAGINLDGVFLAQVERELTRVMGPVAALIIDDELAAIGASRDALPREQAAGLLEKVSAEISDEAKRTNFIKTVLKALENQG